MKKIVLLNTPMDMQGDDRLFPCLGIATLAAILRNRGYHCDIIDGDLPDNHSIEKITDQLVKYDLVGISANTPSFQAAVIIARAVKCIKNIPILLGGHYATFMHKFIVEQYDCFDAIIRGEGESPIVALCEDFFTHGFFINVLDYVTYRNINGKIYLANTIAVENDLDCLPFPVRDQFEQYLKSGDEIVTISSSRGCPYGCSFCSATSFRKNWAARSPKNIAEEVFTLYQKINNFKIAFVDDNFYMNPERSIQIIVEIQKKCNKKFEFIFATRADQIINNGNDNLKSLKELGCIEIEMGIENGSNTVLKRFNKNINSSQNQLAIQMIEEQQIKAVVDYVLFDPETTMIELKENIEFMKASKLWGYDPPLIYERIIAFPGTDFTKKHPHIYNESCYISGEIYFVDKQVYEIYRCLQSFRRLYQIRINTILSKIRDDFSIERIFETYKKDFFYLKVLPYFLLEKLLYSDLNYKDIYHLFIQANKIPERLERYELQFSIEKPDLDN